MHRITLFALVTLFAAQQAWAVPDAVRHTGRLTDAAGTPLNATTPLTIGLYADGSIETPIWSTTLNDVRFDNGYFAVDLTIPLEHLDGTTRYLGYTVGTGDEMRPRTALVSVPYALRAAVADNTADLSLFDGVIRACPTGGGQQTFDADTLTWSDCSWNCQTDPNHPGCIGGGSSSAYATCADIADDPTFDGNHDGLYIIDPDGPAFGDAPIQAYCLMSQSGGGWTLVMNVDTNDGNYVDWENTNFWTSSSVGAGSDGNAMTGDYKNVVAYRDVLGAELLAMVHLEGSMQAWRTWNMTTPRTMYQTFQLPIDSTATSSTTGSFNTASLDTYEPMVRGAGNVYVNLEYGVSTSNDYCRIINTASAGLAAPSFGNNTVTGIGTRMDVSNGAPGSWWDAGYGSDGSGYQNSLMGTDEKPDCWGAATNSRGLYYDYAFFVR